MSHRGRLSAVLLVALLCTGGCTTGGGSTLDEAEPSATAAPSPSVRAAQDELSEALQQTQGATFRYTVRGNLPDGERVNATGAYDARSTLLQDTITITGG